MYNNIKALYEAVMNCRKCRLSQTRRHVVFGEGNLHADVMFVAAGQLLCRMLDEIGLRRGDVYIANVVKCRPPGNRDPQDDERAACIGYLRNQVAFIKPKVIVCLGRIAAGVILGRDVRMMKEHGVCVRVKNFYIMPTFHPAALLHNPDYAEHAKNDFQVLKETLHELNLS